jgi:hypothetical protein
VSVKVSRQAKLTEPVTLELRKAEGFTARPVVVAGKTDRAVLRVAPTKDLLGVHAITIRGTALQDSKYRVVSETTVAVEFLPAAPAASKPR